MLLAREKEPVHKLWTDTHKWRLIDYFDVWFNEDEGYWVNDQTEVLDDLIMTDDVDNNAIFDYLKDSIGIFGPEAKYEDMTFDGDDFYIEIATERDGYWYPLCRLERMD